MIIILEIKYCEILIMRPQLMKSLLFQKVKIIIKQCSLYNEMAIIFTLPDILKIHLIYFIE